MRFVSLISFALSTVSTYAATFPVTGATGGVHPRLEIRDLHNDYDTYNLFMLAMHRWYQSNQSLADSYYGIAGIHGVPNKPWDGVQANPESQAEGAVGYCGHTSILFPTWHRAYTTLFEQVFQKQVQAVVNEWPSGAYKTKLQGIASTMRFPYFDWAAAPPNNLPSFPLVLSSMGITLKTANGNINVINPLFRYDFQPLNPNDMLNFQPWSFWTWTRRYPSTNASAGAYSQNNLAADAFRNNRINIRNQLYSVFTQCPEFGEFSNDGSADSTAGCGISLEGIHDNIHNMLGGSNQGHMTYLWFAAFDPVFWLHHMYDFCSLIDTTRTDI